MQHICTETCLQTYFCLNLTRSVSRGGFSEMLHRSFKLEKKNYLFFLETSLIHLGASPDIIGKIS